MDLPNNRFYIAEDKCCICGAAPRATGNANYTDCVHYFHITSLGISFWINDYIMLTFNKKNLRTTALIYSCELSERMYQKYNKYDLGKFDISTVNMKTCNELADRLKKLEVFS